MPVSFRVAQTTEQKAQVFRLRRQVFVEEEERFAHPSDLIFDEYDTFDETVNILATMDGAAIGTVRVTVENSIGMPALDHYDFRPLMERLGGKFASVGWFCISQAHRKHRGLLFGLFKMLVREARNAGARHVIAPLHPGILVLLKRVGGKEVGPEFHSEELNVSMVPIHVDLDELPLGVRETFQDPSDIILQESNERRIYREGDCIVRRNEPGTEAYLVMRGSVRVLTGEEPGPEFPSDSSQGDGMLFGPGQIFGELSLLDSGPRTTTVVCHSKEADLMVWTQDQFLEQLRGDGDRATDVCRILGSRLRAHIEQRAAETAAESLIARILIGASNDASDPVETRWLASQCGLWPKELAGRVAQWEENGWITRAPDGLLHVMDLPAMRELVVME